jgi:hypothetical protein
MVPDFSVGPAGILWYTRMKKENVTNMDKRHHMHYHATPCHAKGGRYAKPSPNEYQRWTMSLMSRIEMSMHKI